MRTFTFILILLIVFPIGGSTQDNPFDVYRQDTVRVDESGRIINTVNHLNNPFDVEHIPYVIDPSAPLSQRTRYQAKRAKNVSPIKSLPLWVFIFSFILLTITININRNTFVNMYKSLANDNFLKLLKREQKNGFMLFFYLLYLLFAFNLALFIWLVLDKWGYPSDNMYFLYILGCIVGIYIIRHLTLFLIGKIYPLEKETSFYSFLIILINSFLGVILLILNVFIEYSPMSNALIYIGMGIILLLYIIRNLKGLGSLVGNRKVGLFHFFIYLCTSEISPNLVIWSYLCNSTINF